MNTEALDSLVICRDRLDGIIHDLTDYISPIALTHCERIRRADDDANPDRVRQELVYTNPDNLHCVGEICGLAFQLAILEREVAGLSTIGPLSRGIALLRYHASREAHLAFLDSHETYTMTPNETPKPGTFVTIPAPASTHPLLRFLRCHRVVLTATLAGYATGLIVSAQLSQSIGLALGVVLLHLLLLVLVLWRLKIH
ncbi:MAG TPA: hypothetical protein VMF06_20135 [Candidatus Limnocylindria bacterium]|jgi:hypothetical protein|nr:hypothetical protein [Candidatus Limnocylindria bacterium]